MTLMTQKNTVKIYNKTLTAQNSTI